MLQRSISRTFVATSASRQFAASSQCRSRVPLRLPTQLPLQSHSIARYYSESTQEVKTGAAGADGGAAQTAPKSAESAAQPTEGEQMKKELESKNKEILDLKVGNTTLARTSENSDNQAGQVPPLGRRLPQPARTDQARGHRGPRLRAVEILPGPDRLGR
jgi:hypothetical protein